VRGVKFCDTEDLIGQIRQKLFDRIIFLQADKEEDHFVPDMSSDPLEDESETENRSEVVGSIDEDGVGPKLGQQGEPDLGLQGGRELEQQGEPEGATEGEPDGATKGEPGDTTEGEPEDSPRPFSCNMCLKSFVNLRNLNRHKKNSCQNPMCRNCRLRFPKAQIKAHRRSCRQQRHRTPPPYRTPTPSPRRRRINTTPSLNHGRDGGMQQRSGGILQTSTPGVNTISLTFYGHAHFMCAFFIQKCF